MSRWATVYKFTWILIVVVCMVGVLFLFIPRYVKYRENKRLIAQYKQDIRIETAAEKQYREYQQRFLNDPSFAEEIARKEGMVKTNESVIRSIPYSETNATREHSG